VSTLGWGSAADAGSLAANAELGGTLSGLANGVPISEAAQALLSGALSVAGAPGSGGKLVIAAAAGGAGAYSGYYFSDLALTSMCGHD